MRIGKRTSNNEKSVSKPPEKSADKRSGCKQVSARTPIANVGLPSYTLSEAVEFVMKVKRANNLKERTLDG